MRISQNDSLIRLVRDENFLAEKIKIAKRKEKEAADRAKELAEQSKNLTATAFPTNPGMPMNPNLGGSS